MATTLNVSALSAYKDELRNEFIADIFATGNTMEFVNPQWGINFGTIVPLNHYSLSAPAQAGGCGLTDSATLTYTQKNLTTVRYAKRIKLCLDDLTQYCVGQFPSKEQNVVNNVLSELALDVKKDVNKFAWMGSTASGSEVGLHQGWIAQLGFDATRTNISGTSSTYSGPFTTSTIIAAVDAMIAGRPYNMVNEPDQYLFLSHKNFELYTTAIATAQMQNWASMYKPEDIARGIIQGPYGKNVTIVRTIEFGDADYMVLTTKKNMVPAFNDKVDSIQTEVVYDPITKYTYFEIDWEQGGNYHFGTKVVTNF